MPKQVDVFFDNSPVFKLEPERRRNTRRRSAGSADAKVLDSGWAWGQQYLDGGTAVAEATVGEGQGGAAGAGSHFRDQPHATYKLLFNGLYYGSAQPVRNVE